jgi:hypothetical protein
MAGLWRNRSDSPEGKYLLKRRDGTIPQWPFFVIAASDPAAPTAINAYARKARNLGMDSQYIEDLFRLADEFEQWRIDHGDGDPDAPRHRIDDPAIIAEMRRGRGA